ncbi:hypothetical protein HII13_001642 [Brettanomyces bruxellensis]|nr:hypothetical protein HII13_001642 [Brettanomyces bruxellensis]
MEYPFRRRKFHFTFFCVKGIKYSFANRTSTEEKMINLKGSPLEFSNLVVQELLVFNIQNLASWLLIQRKIQIVSSAEILDRMIPMYEEEKTSEMKQSRFNLKVLISTLTATIITAVLCIGSTKLYNRELDSLSLLRELYDDKNNICPVTEKMIPSKSEQFSELDYFRTSKYKNHSVEVWGNAVRIPSMTYDDYPENGDDHKFDIFYKMESFIKKSFPISSQNQN